MSKLFDLVEIALVLCAVLAVLSNPDELQRIIQDLMMAGIHR